MLGKTHAITIGAYEELLEAAAAVIALLLLFRSVLAPVGKLPAPAPAARSERAPWGSCGTYREAPAPPGATGGAGCSPRVGPPHRQESGFQGARDYAPGNNGNLSEISPACTIPGTQPR